MSRIAKGVTLRGVTKRFGDVVAVDAVSLSVEPGDFVSLLGPSGCGKTTTLRMIAGFEDPDAGDVLLGEASILGVPPHRRDTSMVFQDYALFPHRTVAQNIAFGLRMRKVPKGEISRKVREMLDLLGLSGMGDRQPEQLSGGQQQRVALGRALVVDPSVLLLDEPLGALDLQLRKQMQLELKRIQRELGITFIYVTHDQEEAITMSDQIAVMNEGRVEQYGAVLDIYTKPATPFVAQFIGEANLVEAEVVEAGQVCRLRTRQGGLSVAAEDPGGLCHETDDVVAVIRPEKVVLGNAAQGMANHYQLKVRDVIFAGPFVRVLGEVNGLEMRATTTAPDILEVAQPGLGVDVGWSPKDVVVVPSRNKPDG